DLAQGSGSNLHACDRVAWNLSCIYCGLADAWRREYQAPCVRPDPALPKTAHYILGLTNGLINNIKGHNRQVCACLAHIQDNPPRKFAGQHDLGAPTNSYSVVFLAVEGRPRLA